MSFLEFSAMLGNIGEFVGAIAVVLTLFYLAIQVKHSKEATEANTRSMEEDRKIALAQTWQANTAMKFEWWLKYADSPVVEIAEKYKESGIDSLDAAERSRFKAFQVADQLHMQNAHFATRRGMLDMSDQSFASAVLGRRKVWEDLEMPTMSWLSENDSRNAFWEDVYRAWNEQDKEEAIDNPN